MKISIFGLGYVGVVTAACLTRDGISVVGVDINPDKVDMLSKGVSPIVEPGLAELIQAGRQSGLLCATLSVSEAIRNTDASLVCVGTPSRSDGKLDLSAVLNVCKEIGQAISDKGKPHVVVIRSTVLPGTTDQCIRLLKQIAGEVAVHVAFNPEFLREGCAIYDYDNPPYTVVGTSNPTAEQALRQIYAHIDARFIVMKTAEAELLKLASNAWHATKIVFSNEIGRIAKSLELDGRNIMQVISEDTKLNISSAYMRPAFAYGGSCLPKDVRALNSIARLEDVETPLLAALQPSNARQIDFARQQVLASGKKRIGMLGLTFKTGTDDLRESPAVELAEHLIGKGYDLRILDRSLENAKLIGVNREAIESRIPHLSKLLVRTTDEFLAHSELIIVTYKTDEFREIIQRANSNTLVIDLVGTFSLPPIAARYSGIAW